MLLQCSYSCKFPASSIFSSAGWRWRYPMVARSRFRWKLHPSSQAWPLLSTSNHGETAMPNVRIGFKSPIFRLCDLEIWWMTPKNNKTCLLYYIKLCVSFQIHQWIQTGVTVRKRPIWIKFNDFFSHHKPCDLAIRCMTLKKNRAPILCYFKICASFRTHWWIQTGATVQKCPIWVKINIFF